MAIEQERTEAAISELHCQTPTRLAVEGRVGSAQIRLNLLRRNPHRVRSESIAFLPRLRVLSGDSEYRLQ